MYNTYTVTTAKNDFNDYYGRSTKYPQLNNNNIQQTPTITTKNPYDFANFNKHSSTTNQPSVSVNDYNSFYSTTPKSTTKNIYAEYNKQFYSTGIADNPYTTAPNGK